MKISKRRLRQIILEEKARLEAESAGTLNEARTGAASLGFASFAPNRNPDFAKAYGKDARVIGRYQNNNNDIMEQPMPAPSADPKENAFQELKMGGAFQQLQEMMTDIERQIDGWQQKYEVMMVDAGLEDEGVEIEDARLSISGIRNLANQLR